MTGTPASGKEEAIAQILQIIEAHSLDAADLRSIVKAAQKDPVAPPNGVPARRVALGKLVLRVFYYLGGRYDF